MSQAKVDKYKAEKKNRAKIIKKQKAKKLLAACIVAILCGTAVGIPLGRKLYKVSQEKAAANRTIATAEFGQWFDDYWNANYADWYAGTDYATDFDATATDASQSDADAE